MPSSNMSLPPITCFLVLSFLLAGDALALVQPFSTSPLSIRDFYSHRCSRWSGLAATVAPRSESSSSIPGEDDIDDDSPSDAYDDDQEVVSYNQARFRRYLQSMHKHVRNKRTLANRMDDELKMMEIQHYKLTGDEAPKCRFERSLHSYNGETCRPDMSSYTMVCNAYAKSGLGKAGAELAEDAYKRYEARCGHIEPPNAIIKTACLNAWCHADDFEKANQWLDDIENCYAATGSEVDAPDFITYTTYLEGLANSRHLPGEYIGKRAKEILEKMQRVSESGENPWARPNRYTYISAMKCQLKNSDGLAMMDRVERIYRQMERDYEKYGTYDLKPKAVSTVSYFNAASRCKGGLKAAEKADKFLHEMKERYEKTGDRDYKPLVGMYVGIMTAYGRVEYENAKMAVQRVDELLEDLQGYGYEPSTNAITAAINARVATRSLDSVREAEEIFRRIENPDTVSYQCLIKAFSKSGDPERADALIQELDESAADHTSSRGKQRNLPADVSTIAACISGYCNFGKDKEHRLERSEALLYRIIDAYNSGSKRRFERDATSWVFEDVIRLLSKSRKPDAGKRINKIIEELEALQDVAPGVFVPSHAIYVLALDAWAVSGHGRAGEEAMNILKRLDEGSKIGRLPRPNVRILSSALASVTKAGGPASGQFAEGILHRIIDLYQSGDRSAQVDIRIVTNVLTAIMKSSDRSADVKAIALLHEMNKLGEKGLPELVPNTIVYNCILTGLANRGLSEQAVKVLNEMKRSHADGRNCAPDILSYSCVCRAMAYSRTPQSVQTLENLLNEVVTLYNNGDASVKPDLYLFNAVIDGFKNVSKKDPRAALKADDLLTRMETSTVGDEKIFPNTQTFASVCHAYAMSNAPESAEKSESILRRAERLAQEGVIEPPKIEFYASVVLAYTRDHDEDSLNKAETIVEELKSKAEAGREDLKPNTRIFNLLLAGYAKSQIPNRQKRVQELMTELEALYNAGDKSCEPDNNAYNWLILAAARASSGGVEEDRESFELAVTSFKTLHETSNRKLQPNSYTYDFFLQACKSLIPAGETREKLASQAFDLSCRNGLMTAASCLNAYRCCKEHVLDKFEIQDEQGKEVIIPREWSKHVPSRIRDERVILS